MREQQTNGERGARLNHATATATKQPRLVRAGEVETRPRLRTRATEGLRNMSEQTARLMRLEPKKPSTWLPLAGFVLAVATAIASAFLAYGVWQGKGEARDEAIADNQKLMTKLVDASEARLTKAAEKLEAKADQLEARLMTKVDSIDNKVDSIASTTTKELAEVRADLRVSDTDRQRLWQQIETYNLKLERLERERRNQPTPPNGPD